VADAHEAFGEHVKQESANKFLDVEGRYLFSVFVSAVTVGASRKGPWQMS